MSLSTKTYLQCELVADDTPLDVAELCRVLGVDTGLVAQLVEHGLIEPAPMRRAEAWVFAGASVTRVRTAVRLIRDLELNPAGATLAVELLDEIARLRGALAARGLDEGGA